MTYKLLLISILFSTISFNSSSIDFESINKLQKQLNKEKNLVQQCDLLIKIANEYWRDDPNNMMKYANKAIEVINQTNDFKYYCMAYKTKSTSCDYLQLLDSCIYYSELSLNYAKLSKNEFQIWSSYSSIAQAYFSNGNYEKALVYYDTSISLIKLNKYEAPVNSSYQGKADCYMRLGDLTNAELYYNIGLKVANSEKDTFDIVKYYNNISILKIMQGKINDTIVNYIDFIIQFAKLKNNKISLANGYATLGSALSIQKDYEQAIINYHKSLPLFIECKDSLNIAISKTNLAENYYLNNQFDSASLNAKQAAILSKKINFGTGIYLGNAINANYLIKQNKLEGLENMLNINYNLAKENKDNYSLGYLSLVLGELYNRLGKIGESNFFSKKALELALESNNNNIKLECYQLFEKNYAAKNLFDSAFLFAQKYSFLKDTILSEKNNLIVRKLNLQFKTKEQQIFLSKTIREKEILNQKNIYLIGGITSIGILLAILSVLFRKTSQQNRDIEELNKTIKHESKRHLSLISITLSNSNYIPEIAIKKGLRLTNAFYSLYETLFISSKKDKLSLKAFILDIYEDNCIAMNIHPPLRINGDIEQKLKRTETLGLALNEILCNSLEHAFEGISKPEIIIDITSEKKSHTIHYYENGIGHNFDIQKLEKDKGQLTIYSLITQGLNGSFAQVPTSNGVHYIIKFKDNA